MNNQHFMKHNLKPQNSIHFKNQLIEIYKIQKFSSSFENIEILQFLVKNNDFFETTGKLKFF